VLGVGVALKSSVAVHANNYPAGFASLTVTVHGILLQRLAARETGEKHRGNERWVVRDDGLFFCILGATGSGPAGGPARAGRPAGAAGGGGDSEPATGRPAGSPPAQNSFHFPCLRRLRSVPDVVHSYLARAPFFLTRRHALQLFWTLLAALHRSVFLEYLQSTAAKSVAAALATVTVVG